MKPSTQQDRINQTDISCRPLLDHLAAELAKEYVRLMKMSATESQNTTEETYSCELQFMPATAQKVNVRRA